MSQSHSDNMSNSPLLAIDVKNLRKSFNGKVAVEGISLKIPKGQIFGFLGPNGSGKTTTIRMLCGLLTPDSGQGHCLGYDVITESLEIKAKAGYMPQKFSLYDDLTVWENLDFIARIYEVENRIDAIDETLERMSLTPRKDQLAGQLSGGWKQRLSLGAALLHKPSVLLLDEPTAGVDPEARRTFWEILYHLSCEGITALVSTHYMDEAQRCHHLTYIAYGELLTEGSPQDIVEHSGLSTFRVSGPDIQNLVNRLKDLSGEHQVVRFGNALHISAESREYLYELIGPYKDHNKITVIKPNLEDVFIHLIRKKEIRDKNYG